MTSNDRYASFLLRLQRAQNENCPIWLTCIQSTKTGELRWFPTLEAFIQFLHEEFETQDLGRSNTKAAERLENDHQDPFAGQIDPK